MRIGSEILDYILRLSLLLFVPARPGTIFYNIMVHQSCLLPRDLSFFLAYHGGYHCLPVWSSSAFLEGERVG